MLISEGGQMICIGASDLRVIGRNTQGVRLFNLKEGDKLVSAAVLDPEEEVEEVETVEGEEGAETVETAETTEAVEEATDAPAEEATED